MDKSILNQLVNQYAPIVNSIIVSNAGFYKLKKPIKWEFFYDERVAIFGKYNNETDILAINICSVAFSF